MLSLPAYARKIAAFFILGMLLFIQAEKVLHRHNAGNHCNHEQVQYFKSSNAGCSICEFQITRDAHLPVAVPVALNSYSFSAPFSIVLSDYSFLHSSQIPNRGPPSMIG